MFKFFFNKQFNLKFRLFEVKDDFNEIVKLKPIKINK